MRKTMIFVLAALLCGLSFGTVSADSVKLWGEFLKNSEITYSNGGVSKKVQIGHFLVGNMGDAAENAAYCAQSGVNVSKDFLNPAVGQSFEKVEFFTGTDIGPYTVAKQNLLKDVLSHMYPVAYKTDGSFRGDEFAKLADSAMQLAIWEIGQENSGSYNILDGKYKVTTGLDAGFAAFVNEILAAMSGDLDWSKVGEAIDAAGKFTMSTKDLTAFYYYTEGDVSQALLQIGYTTDPSEVVPEPATAAILGLGLIGAGFFARRRRK